MANEKIENMSFGKEDMVVIKAALEAYEDSDWSEPILRKIYDAEYAASVGEDQ